MNWYWVKTNRIIKRIFSNYVWDIPAMEKKIYLTFDDGPTPEITSWVLSQLEEFNAKATFFCIGNNIEKHPEIFKAILQDGHVIGNHTFNHNNGWKTKTEEYIATVEQCEIQFQKSEIYNPQSKLFRPPYGKIKKSQAKLLLDSGYKIIMWDILSADFDATITPQKCLNNVLKNIQHGSIVIFHDSVKAFKNLEYTLPKTLLYLKQNGYQCEVLV